MKIIVVSDTHGNVDGFIKEIKNHPDCEMIIHLGDYTDDARKIKNQTDKKLIFIRGNNDFMDFKAQDEKVIYIKGHKIFLTHGHQYNVYFGLERLAYKAMEVGADLVLFGHSHINVDESYRNIRLINPGSTTYPRGGDMRRGFMILDLDESAINTQRIYLD